MGQTVYVDLFFLINFSMDFLCFFLASELLGGRLPIARTLLASAVGGIYANVALFISVGGIWEILLDVGVCILMCLIVFGKGRSIVAHTCVYIAISMALGGFMTALFALLNRAELPLDEIQSDGISAWLLMLLAIISGLITLFGGRFFRRKSARKYTALKVIFDGRSKTLSAYCDSGNLLRDPISGRPCIVADTDALRDILPKGIIEASKNKIADASSFSEDVARKIRLIPTKTATGEGILLALRADKIFVGEGKDEREVNAMLAVCELEKSNEGCQALVPAELMI